MSSTIEPLVASESQTPTPSTKPKPARLTSLDIMRGFTVCLMIFVDDVGDAYPSINHSPWDNITLADFVMPWFLFMVGTSLSISLRKYRAAPRKGFLAVITRAAKLFGLGVVLQGGDWFDGEPSFGYNLSTLRFCGILNRIGYAYLVAACIELFVPELPTAWPARVSSSGASSRRWCYHVAVFTTQAPRWLAAFAFVGLHLGLTFLTWVPTWHSRYGYNATSASQGLLSHPFEVACDVRGVIHTPECSAASYYDRLLFGQDHLGVWMSRRLPQCSSCSPGNPNHMYRPGCVPIVTDETRWCFARMYDPEGALASVPTVMSVWLGAHFGRVLRFEGLGLELPDGVSGHGVSGHGAVLSHWAVVSALLIGGGLAVHAAGLPMNKQLWSPSYLLFMAGTCGGALAAVYAAVDTASALGQQSTLSKQIARHHIAQPSSTNP